MKANPILKYMFILGALIDGAISASWFMIATGWNIPNILNGYIGIGSDYRLAMYTAAMFMAGWAVLLAWGALKPVERRGLLLITAGFLLLSVIAEFTLFRHMVGGAILVFGVTKRLVLTVLFTTAYFYSRSHAGQFMLVSGSLERNV
jgi:hypothetical protein